MPGSFGLQRSPTMVARPNTRKANDNADKALVRDTIRQGLASVGTRAAPVSAPTSLGQYTAAPTRFGAGQDRLAAALEAQASGRVPGAGELAVARQAQRAQANAYGAAAGARGLGVGMAAREAARAAHGIGLDAAGQAEQAQINDQSNARQLLAGVLGQGRGQDLEQAGQQTAASFSNAGLLNQTAGQNLQSQLQTMGMNDQAVQAYLSQMQARQAQRSQEDQARRARFGGYLTTAGTALPSLV